MKFNFSLILIAVCFLAGIILGSVFAMTIANGGDLEVFFSEMVSGAKDGVLQNSFWRVLLPNMIWPMLIILFSFSSIGLAGIPACILIKSFLISYSVSAIYRSFGVNGIWLALTSIGIPNALYIPLLVIVSMLGLKAAGGAQVKKFSPAFHAPMAGIFIGIAAFQAFLQPKIVTWLLK
ncbi:MAG: hypothetical protein FWG36_06360 [Oscillospiraceae bacterium]|nr:hypothetical protein [Oscillospiraceae bacterium]